MRNLAPDIMRQRLLIEGRYSADVDQNKVAAYLSGLAQYLELRTYGKPTIHVTGGAGKTENEEAVSYTREFFQATEIAYSSF